MSAPIHMIVLSVRSEYAGRPLRIDYAIAPETLESAKFDVFYHTYNRLCWELEKEIERLKEAKA